LKRIAVVAAVVGAAGTYWSWRLLQWFVSAETLKMCILGETCPVVFDTAFSRFLGLPIHLFALVWFLGLTILAATAAARSVDVWRHGLALASLSIPTVIYLDYVQIVIIGAICWDCVTAHVLGLALFGTFLAGFLFKRNSRRM